MLASCGPVMVVGIWYGVPLGICEFSIYYWVLVVTPLIEMLGISSGGQHCCGLWLVFVPVW